MIASPLSSAKSDHALRGDYSACAEDFTIDQDWSRYRQEDHALWRKLYARQAGLVARQACAAFNGALTKMAIADAVPDLARINRDLGAATGWRLVAVPGFVPDEVFFAHLERRQFPVTIWLRDAAEIDYLVEPDIFHDFFGHVPLLFDPVFADYLQVYGLKGREALRLGATPMLARLYWYMVEFGLIREQGAIKAFGAGILSSHAETLFATTDPSPHRIAFDLERVMRTQYRIDDFQEVYFVLENFADLFAASERDFRPLYAAIEAAEPLAPGALIAEDRLYHRGTGAWKKSRASRLAN